MELEKDLSQSFKGWNVEMMFSSRRILNIFLLTVLLLQNSIVISAQDMEDTPLHPDTDLVADILGQRPDVSISSEATPKTTRTTASWNNPIENRPTSQPPFFLPSIQDDPSCGGLLMAKVNQVDTLFSPGFPGSYPSDLHCKWTVKAPPGFKVVGQFVEFDLTDSDDCQSDYVQIAGVTSMRSGDEVSQKRHCGKTAPEDFIDGDSAVELVFHTNQGDACKGFAFQYRLETSHVTCGEVSAGSEFEFTNMEFPAAVPNETQHCSIQVSHDCETPICQMRLDLVEFELASPLAGNCEQDQFIIRANEPLPILCGRNTGQHLYVDVRGRKLTDLSIITDALKAKPVGYFNEETQMLETEWKSELDRERKWRIRVTQIPCDCRDREDPDMKLAPAGCLQFYQGIRGNMQSFNFDGSIRNLEPCYNGSESQCGQELFTGHLNNMDYTICIEDYQGYCGISYNAHSLQDFQMSGILDNIDNEPDLEGIQPTFGETNCYDDYVFIPRGHHPEDMDKKYTNERYCGHRLGNRLAGPVVSHSRPFLFRVKTDASEPFTGVALSNRGFNLEFKQIPCSLSGSDAISFA